MPADGQIMDLSRTLERENNMNGSVKQVLLDGCVPFSHQVAGHKCGINNTGQFKHISASDVLHVIFMFFFFFIYV